MKFIKLNNGVEMPMQGIGIATNSKEAEDLNKTV